jgi:O-antigen ligase
VFLEFYSNRHFYVVPTRLAFNSATAYYRIGLYDEAFGGGMKGHWMFGYGYVGVGPGNDNTNFHWHYRDFTSIYIGRLVRHGLFGLLPFLVLPIIYYRYLYAAHQHAKRRRDKLLVYCFSAGLVGWSFGTLTVGFVAQTQTLFYMFMGIANNMPMMMEKIYGPIEKKRGRRGRRKRFEQELIQPEAATPTLTGETKGDTV